MQQNELVEIAQIVATRLAKFNTFDIYDEDDIGQEIFLLCVEADKVYDPERTDPESYFYNYCKLRLKNLKRDKFVNPALKDAQSQAAVKCPLSISQYELDFEEARIQDLIVEYEDLIDKKVPASLRDLYLKYRDGVTLTYNDRLKIFDFVRDVIENNVL